MVWAIGVVAMITIAGLVGFYAAGATAQSGSKSGIRSRRKHTQRTRKYDLDDRGQLLT
jgi:hypothetical protein